MDFWDVVGVASPADAVVGRSLNISGWDVLEEVAKATIGETMWQVLRAFVRGFEEGLRHAPAAQVGHLEEKWSSIGPSDAEDFIAGYLKGVLIGLWNGLVGLVETVIELVKLPIRVAQFLEGLREMASRWGARIAQLIQRGSALMGQFAAELTNDPAGTVARLRQLAEGAGDAILNLVHGAGRDAAAGVLKFLDQDWDKIGEDVGKLVGRILFEVLLALVTDLIGNVVKEAVRVIGALFAKGVEAAAEIVRLIRGLIARVLTWLQGLAGRLTGRLGSLLEELRVLVADFGRLFEQMGPEFAVEGGGGMRMSATKGLGEGVRTETRAVPRPTEPASVPKPTEHAPAPKPTEPEFKELTKPEYDKLKPAEQQQYLTQWMKAHNVKRIIRSAKHHAWPEYLGGPAKQPLLSLDELTHIKFHSLLDTALPRSEGAAFYAAKSLAEKSKDIATLRRIARDFDLVEGTRISEQLTKVLKGTPFENQPF
ncbi:MAG TPA: hypothetical protein VFI54_15175 [Solirubrobacteraceae bacterium]|nr:hypothetical protein [Solirubrobacteraceae bacterium]